MLTSAQTEQFATQGFLIIPNVLTPDEVRALRSQVRHLFDEPSRYPGDIESKFDAAKGGATGAIRFDICTRYPELRWLLSHRPITEPISDLLGGDFVFLPEMSAHFRGFGHWHKDTTSQERAGEKFHWEPDYLMVEAALYLQANSREYGGGLDVIPGSHLESDTYLDNIDHTVIDRVRTKLKTWRERVMKTRNRLSIPSKPGDLVIFHFRIDHRASWPTADVIPSDNEKLALFFACSRNDRHAARYVEYISKRPDYLYLKGHRYPDELIAELGPRRLAVPAPKSG